MTLCEACWKDTNELMEAEGTYICIECYERIEVENELHSRTDE